ncbi:hypothetical protein ACFPK1_08510 [Actinomycetospora rhizophila]|uniref:Uncharacterized protein n=1 Tax=Actinomycetospora rhizophila TaxID=1416876 RepID=A0ABV9ZFN8_9PSEU
MLSRGDLSLVLSVLNGRAGGSQAMPDGRTPRPGGWNRFVLEVTSLERVVEELRRASARFRNDIIVGVGGEQTLLDGPSSDPFELFEQTPLEAKP